MRAAFLSALLRHMGVDPAVSDRPGVTVAADPSRAETHVTAGYVLGDHFVVTCDPAVEDMLRSAATEMLPTLDAWHELATANGGELLGAGRMQLLDTHELPALTMPEGFELRELSRDVPEDVAAISRLIDASSEDDLDEADLELDNLDATILAIVDEAGEIASYSSARPFDMAEGFADIGILTHTEHRGKGLGRAAVAALCPSLIEAGLEPLYRCGEDNTGSVALSRGLGFTPATQLAAYRFTTE